MTDEQFIRIWEHNHKRPFKGRILRDAKDLESIGFQTWRPKTPNVQAHRCRLRTSLNQSGPKHQTEKLERHSVQRLVRRKNLLHT